MHTLDWEQLGIGPTTDAAAIKRAYALKLRRTRPDDDARAYQRLREAYDRALWWARHAVQDVDEAVPPTDATGPGAPPAPEPDPPPAPLQQAAPPPAPTPAPTPAPLPEAAPASRPRRASDVA